MDAVITVAGAATLWLVSQIFWQLVGEAGAIALEPFLAPVWRSLARMVSGPTVALLWCVALASYVGFVESRDSEAPAVRGAALLLFMSATPLALAATLHWRGSTRRRR